MDTKTLQKDINEVKRVFNHVWQGNRDILTDLVIKKDDEIAMEDIDTLEFSLLMLIDKLEDYNINAILMGRIYRRMA